MRNGLQSGDVFEMPFSDTHLGYGQVMITNDTSPLYVYVFEPLFEKSAAEEASRIVRSRVLLAASTFDALIHNGDWPIIGRAEVDASTTLVPVFKVMQDGIWMLQDFVGKTLGRANQSQATELPLRFVTSPMNLQDAFAAHHGAREWIAAYDKFLYSNVARTGKPMGRQ